MFALIAENSDPVRISLKCDPTLSKVLRDKFETVMPGYHLNKNHWNTIVLTGQIPWNEIQDLIRHSYNLVVKNDLDIPVIE
jgi:predicted DNA-binding protein (MmcQ/YjbR family)